MELNITDLTKSFRDLKAVDHVSYTFGSGVYGLLGVNGAGLTMSAIPLEAVYMACWG